VLNVKQGLISAADQSDGFSSDSYSYLKNGLWWAGMLTSEFFVHPLVPSCFLDETLYPERSGTEEVIEEVLAKVDKLRKLVVLTFTSPRLRSTVVVGEGKLLVSSANVLRKEPSRWMANQTTLYRRSR
jgi:hypothetical protein